MKFRHVLLVALTPVVLFSCVSTKKFKAEQTRYSQLKDSLSGVVGKLQGDLKSCEDQKAEEARKKQPCKQRSTPSISKLLT